MKKNQDDKKTELSTENNKQTFTTELVKGTPIIKVTCEETGVSFAAVARERVTEDFKTKEELNAYIESKPLELIFTAVASYIAQKQKFVN